MKTRIVLLAFLGKFCFQTEAGPGTADGHEIVVVIATDESSPTGRSHLAQILGVFDDTSSLEKAMAPAAIPLDT